MKKRKLQFENYHSAGSILDKYDPVNDCWTIPKTGDFWDAINEAHRNGFQGKGKRIAIIDSAFDLDLLKHKKVNKIVHAAQKSPQNNQSHGTAVALLVAEVAPLADLDLYEVSRNNLPDENLIRTALKNVSNSDADIINLSIGRPANNEIAWLRSKLGLDHCNLCHATSRAALSGKIVVASAGNAEGEMLCPARDTHVFGIGFQTEERISVKTSEGGISEKAMWGKPTFTQVFNSDYTIMQPPGVLGSSFAAPLISGAIALLSETSNIQKYFKAVPFIGTAEALHANLNNNSTNHEVELVKKYYLQAISYLPHQHKSIEEGPPCVACSIFVQGLYVNAGLFFLETGNLELAQNFMLGARFLAPWSAHAAANLATLLRVIGNIKYEQFNDRMGSIQLYNLSRNEYLYALKLNPGCMSYLSGLSLVDQFLAQLK